MGVTHYGLIAICCQPCLVSGCYILCMSLCVFVSSLQAVPGVVFSVCFFLVFGFWTFVVCPVFWVGLSLFSDTRCSPAPPSASPLCTPQPLPRLTLGVKLLYSIFLSINIVILALGSSVCVHSLTERTDHLWIQQGRRIFRSI